MKQIYLTRRNLLSLLKKLDRRKQGEETFCTIQKRDTRHPVFPCEIEVQITAVEDEDYYLDRPPGAIHPKDDPRGQMEEVKE